MKKLHTTNSNSKEERKMKKALSLILALGMTVSTLVGCGQGAADSSSGDSVAGTESSAPAEGSAESAGTETDSGAKKVVHIAFHDPLSSLDPYQGMGDAVAYLQVYGYEPLFYKTMNNGVVGGDGSQELYNGIGKAWEKIDDYTYEVEIYDYVHDTEGNHITADDVVFSFQTCIDGGKLAVTMGGVESIEKVDDYKVRLVLNNTQAGSFENCITQPGIVSQKAYEEHGGFVNELVSTSAYKLVDFISGASFKFVKNEDYWQKDELRTMFSQTNVDEAVITIVTEDASRAMSIQTGDADIASRVTSAQMYLFEGNSDYTIFSLPNSLTYLTSFNMGGSKSASGKASVVEDNVLLRKAILTGIDQKAFVATVAAGNGDVAYTYGNEFYPDFVQDWKNQEYYDFDLEKAKEMRTEAGYGEGELSLTILTNSSPVFTKNAEVLQSCLIAMGIKAELYSVDPAVFVDVRNSWEGWDMVVDNKGAGDFMSSIYKYSFDQDMYGGATQCGYTDEEMQVLLRAAMDAETHSEETVDAFHQYLKETAISYGIYYDYYNFPATSKIKSCPFSDKNAFLFGAAEYDPSLFN